MRLIGVCAAVAFVLAAIGVSSASAAEVGECLHVAPVEGHVHGKYIDKNCRVPATPTQEAEGKHNKWEWSPGVAPEHAAFTAKSRSASLVGAAGTIECEKSSTVGEWTGPKTGTETTTFVGCAIKTPELDGQCTSAGQPEETIVTSALEITLVGEGESSPEFNAETSEYEPKVVGPGEVWEQLRGPGNELASIWTEYECGKTVVIQTEGSLAGVVPPAAFPKPSSVNVMSKKSEVHFHEGEGAQGWLSEASILGKGFFPIGKSVLAWAPQMKATGKVEFKE
jgi:hypothetical protein